MSTDSLVSIIDYSLGKAAPARFRTCHLTLMSLWLTTRVPGRRATAVSPEAALLYEHIGKSVRSRRRSVGFSQQAVASRVAMTRTSITNLEQGQQQIPLHTLYEIAEALDCPLKDLLPDDLPKPEYGEDVARWVAQLERPAGQRAT
jgi:DNA-binding XRE family transcriptional regulator